MGHPLDAEQLGLAVQVIPEQVRSEEETLPNQHPGPGQYKSEQSLMSTDLSSIRKHNYSQNLCHFSVNWLNLSLRWLGATSGFGTGLWFSPTTLGGGTLSSGD